MYSIIIFLLFFCPKLSWYRSWLNQFNKDNMDANSELSSSGCVVQLFANRPTRHCHSNLVNLKTVLVPLVKSDIASNNELLKYQCNSFTVCAIL